MHVLVLGVVVMAVWNPAAVNSISLAPLPVSSVSARLSLPGGPVSGGVATDSGKPEVPDLPPDPWPRKAEVGDRTLEVYQPQVADWTGNRLTLRAAIAVKPAGTGDEAFGTVQVQTRTQVDKVQRQVVLEDFKIVKADFPTLPGQGASLATAAERQLADAIHIVPLDRLEAVVGGCPGDTQRRR